MSLKAQKILLGILLILPIVLFSIGLLFSMADLIDGLGNAFRLRSHETSPMDAFLGKGLVNLGTGGFVLCTIIFPIHALLNRRLDLQTRIVWVVVMMVASTLAHIPYYIVYILRDKGLPYPPDQQPLKTADQPWPPR